MTPLFLNTPELLAEYWERVAIHFEPVVNEAARGEFTVTDIRQRCEKNRALACVVLDGDEVVLSVAIEFVFYPRKTACNVLAIGGSRLEETLRPFFITFREWLYGMGVTVIEASCSSAMSRLLKRYGFAKTYEVVRLEL